MTHFVALRELREKRSSEHFPTRALSVACSQLRSPADYSRRATFGLSFARLSCVWPAIGQRSGWGAGLLALSLGCREHPAPPQVEARVDPRTSAVVTHSVRRTAASRNAEVDAAAHESLRRERARVDAAAAAAALARWRAKGPASYTFVSETSCHCPDVGPVRVVVEHGRVTRARTLKTGLLALSQAQTMTEVLQHALAQARRGNDVFKALYGSRLGQLQQLVVHENQKVFDSDYGISVSCFSPSTSDRACPLTERREVQR